MVKIFYNSLHRKCKVIDEAEKEWLLDSVVLANAKFVVDAKKRAEYLKTQIPNNHAFVQGDFIKTDAPFVETDGWTHCRYDREKGEFLTVKTGEVVEQADLVFIVTCEIYIKK